MSKTIREIIETLSEEQKKAVYALLDSSMSEEENVQHSNIDASELSGSIFSDAKRDGSLKDSFLEHAAEYGIDGIETLFPNNTSETNKPKFLRNKVEWVNKVLGSVHKVPFTRVKATFVDVRPEILRAKGYTKGTLKKEDILSIMSRTTDPTTIYKKQKLDRDDVIDITDFEVVAWIKDELRMKLDEELARSILIGDGRSNLDDDKIDPECIRPILNDEDLFTIKVPISSDVPNVYEEFIDTCIRARKSYFGSGSPTLFTTEDLVVELLLLKDKNGRRLYNSVEDLKTSLRVSEIVEVSYMKDLKRDAGDRNTHDVMGIIVNLADYDVGTDKGGKVAMFDDFDIDYNQQKYLIETRCSGALTVPYSAIVIEKVTTG